MPSVVSLPLALGGESVGGNNTGVAVVSLVSIVFCCVMLAALWYFVFRGKPPDKRDRG